MIYEKYIKTNKAEFIEKVKSISAKLGIMPDWLMLVMYAESRLNEKAVNKNSGATGLIQFMPDTAVNLGTSTSALYNMTNVKQLDYVLKYFILIGASGKMKSVHDLYLATFFPAALGKPDSWIIHSNKLKPAIIAKANPGIDLNKDLVITIAEFKNYVNQYLKKKNIDVTTAVKVVGISTGTILLITSIIYFGIKYLNKK